MTATQNQNQTQTSSPANLIISISGVRGIVGESMTPVLAARFGSAFATLLGEGASVVVGRDTRPSGPMVASALVSGLVAGGARVTDLGIATTPATALATKSSGAAGGVVITASHNPAPWNGLKFLRPSGVAVTDATGKRLREIFESQAFRLVPVERLHPVAADGGAAERHAAAVLGLLDAPLIRGRRFRVALDSVNGAGSVEGPAFLEALGCEVVRLACVPDGRFPHTPEPTAENLTGLCGAVREHRAAVSFAQDPDADRLAVVDETGRYIGEECTLALAAEFLLRRRKGPVAANLSTSRMIDDIAARHGVAVHRSPVGEAHVADAIAANGCVLGGEGNGGVIEPRIVPVRDSLTGMGYVLQLMAETGKPLSALADELPRYHMIKTKFACAADRAGRIVEGMKARYAGKAGVRVDTRDGLRLDFDEGWVHVRPSNTEPIFRVIGEARTADAARDLCKRIEAEALSVG
jgi:phosphomannomutase